MDDRFRDIDHRERGLLDKLLDDEFPGRDELRTQLGSLTARQAHEDGTLILRCESGTPAATKFRLVAEGICQDDDGGTISILLHVNKEGFMHLLEIVKDDGSSIIRSPSADDMLIL